MNRRIVFLIFLVLIFSNMIFAFDFNSDVIFLNEPSFLVEEDEGVIFLDEGAEKSAGVAKIASNIFPSSVCEDRGIDIGVSVEITMTLKCLMESKAYLCLKIMEDDAFQRDEIVVEKCDWFDTDGYRIVGPFEYIFEDVDLTDIIEEDSGNNGEFYLWVTGSCLRAEGHETSREDVYVDYNCPPEEPEIECSRNSDCGTSGYTGSQFCKNNDEYKKYKIHTCNNAGKSNSYCSSLTSDNKIEECGSSGYSGSNYCYDDDVYRDYIGKGCADSNCFLSFEIKKQQECIYGCNAGSCKSKPVDCPSSVCGGYKGDYSEYANYRFYNLGSPPGEGYYFDNNNCKYQNYESCEYGCSNGVCNSKPAECSSGQTKCDGFRYYECSKGDWVSKGVVIGKCGVNCITGDKCVGENYYKCKSYKWQSQGKVEGKCGHDECTSHALSKCYNNDLYWYDSCNKIETKKQECGTLGCSNNKCDVGSIICSKNSDCGTNSWTGLRFCSNNDVYQKYVTWTCHNSGKSNSYCSYSTSNKLKEDCKSGYSGSNYCYNNDVYRDYLDRSCSGGNCGGSKEKRKQQECTYGCDDGKCNSKPVEIECSRNSDCGVNGWTGDREFCKNNDVWHRWKTWTCHNPGQSSSWCQNNDADKFKQDCGADGCSRGECKEEELEFDLGASRKKCSGNTINVKKVFSKSGSNKYSDEACLNYCTGLNANCCQIYIGNNEIHCYAKTGTVLVDSALTNHQAVLIKSSIKTCEQENGFCTYYGIESKKGSLILGVSCGPGKKCYRCNLGYERDGNNCVKEEVKTCEQENGFCTYYYLGSIEGTLIQGVSCGSGKRCYKCNTRYKRIGSNCVRR